jgi:uncharacterized protein
MVNRQLYIAPSGKKGRGIFTKKYIKKGTRIETAPVIIMSADEQQHLEQTLLYNYIFEWQPDGANMCCMALGWVPLYNHSYESNCEYYMDYEDNTIFIEAVRDIEPGEELTINYNGSWNNKDKVWFDAV